MTISAVTLTAAIADAALAEIAKRQSDIDAAEARAALLERELAFVNERLASANARADRLALENRSLRTLAESRRAAVIALTMRSATAPAPAPAPVQFRSVVVAHGCRSLLDALRADQAHRHEHAFQELLDLLARHGKAGSV